MLKDAWGICFSKLLSHSTSGLQELQITCLCKAGLFPRGSFPRDLSANFGPRWPSATIKDYQTTFSLSHSLNIHESIHEGLKILKWSFGDGVGHLCALLPPPALDWGAAMSVLQWRIAKARQQGWPEHVHQWAPCNAGDFAFTLRFQGQGKS